MMRNPLQVLGLLTFYLFLVLKWGPKFMEKRKAYDLKWIMIVYNIGRKYYGMISKRIDVLNIFLSFLQFKSPSVADW